MAANKIFNFEPVYISNTVGNLLNCGITSLSGPVGYTQTQPYIIVKHIRLQNQDTAQHTVTLYKGATGGSSAGTQFAFAAAAIPASSFLDWYGQARFDSTDFLTGIADAASKVSITIEGEIGLS